MQHFSWRTAKTVGFSKEIATFHSSLYIINWLNSTRCRSYKLKSDAPACLKKELDTVLALQANIDNADRAIQVTKLTMEKQDISDGMLEILQSLQCTHKCLMSKIDILYTSLNVGDKFPKLQDINLNFIQTLLLAHDLKINLCKWAIGSFFE